MHHNSSPTNPAPPSKAVPDYSLRPAIHFCQSCGTKVEQRIPDDGDTKVRAVCPACGHIHYQNPLLVVGTIPVWEGKILLCKRNIEPRYGKWTLPAGFMELRESTESGALRETDEEAGVAVESLGLFSVINVERAGQVYMFYRARVTDPALNPGVETIEARYFAVDEIPWEEIAFRAVETTLRWYIEAVQDGDFKVRSA